MPHSGGRKCCRSDCHDLWQLHPGWHSAEAAAALEEMDKVEELIALSGGSASDGGQLPTSSAADRWPGGDANRSRCFAFLTHMRSKHRQSTMRPASKARLDEAFPGWAATGEGPLLPFMVDIAAACVQTGQRTLQLSHDERFVTVMACRWSKWEQGLTSQEAEGGAVDSRRCPPGPGHPRDSRLPPCQVNPLRRAGQ